MRCVGYLCLNHDHFDDFPYAHSIDLPDCRIGVLFSVSEPVLCHGQC